MHLVGGIVGTLLIGFFGTTAVNSPVGVDGLFYGGGFTQLGKQAVAAFVGAGLLVRRRSIIALHHQVHDRLPGQRGGRGRGIDETEHAETAYDFSTSRWLGLSHGHGPHPATCVPATVTAGKES